MNLTALTQTHYAPASSLREPAPQTRAPSQAECAQNPSNVEAFQRARPEAPSSTFRLRSYLPSAYEAQRHPARRKGSYA